MRRLFLMLSLLLPVTVLGSSASWAQSKLDASIFSYDGKDFTPNRNDLDARRTIGGRYKT